MVRAEHSSTVSHDGAVHDSGEPVGYMIELENGYKIYHSGDTGVFGDMRMIGDYYKPDLALVCIGGWFTMGPEEAAYAMGSLMQPKMVIPMHYGTFPALKGTPREMIDALGDSPINVKIRRKWYREHEPLVVPGRDPNSHVTIQCNMGMDIVQQATS